MRLWALPLRLLLILVLAALVSGAWLFRQDLVRAVRPRMTPMSEALGAGAGQPGPRGLERAREKVDSLHGWAVDSVVLTAGEMASLLANGLPPQLAAHLDSLSVELGIDRIRISARLETAQILRTALGALAGALGAWERVAAEGPVVATAPGQAEWRVDALSVRDFTLPAETSRRLIERALPGAKDGVVPLVLPRGISNLRIRPTGVALYRKEPR
jgi:hypothetical protein